MANSSPSRPPLVHPALGDSACARPLADVQTTDRARLALVFQGGTLLSHLAAVGARLADGWEPLRVVVRDGAVCLCGLEIAPGRSPLLPQEQLTELLALAFEVRRTTGEAIELAGRGEARRAARELLGRWRQRLTPVPPDLAVGQILRQAPWLWEDELGPVREALVAEIGEAFRVAGPTAFALEVERRAVDAAAARTLVATPEAREIYRAGQGADDPSELAAAGRFAEAVAVWRRQPPESDDERLGFADALDAEGRFEEAVALAGELERLDAQALVLRCRLDLGERRAVRRELGKLERSGRLDRAARGNGGERRSVRELARLAVRAIGGDIKDRSPKEAARWVEWAQKAVDGSVERADGALVAAFAAWDRGDGEKMEKALGEVADLLGEKPEADGDLLCRFHQARSLAALDRDDPAEAVAALETALGDHRRSLRVWQAGGLWNDLGLARAHGGDLPGSERAFYHAQRLLGRCDGPRQGTLALANLAEVRLRRGRLRGVAAILHRGLTANRAAGNLRGMVHDLVLAARLEMTLGRPEAALDRLSEAADRAGTDGWQSAERGVLEARVLGWLGRADEARAALASAGSLGGELEPEERPAVRALAGDWDGALREADQVSGTSEESSQTSENNDSAQVSGTSWLELWQALAEGREAPVELWRPVEGLEPFRLARAVLDAELAGGMRRDGPVAPAPLRRRAAAVLRRVGAVAFAERLDRLDRLDGAGGAWGALESYLSGEEPGHPRALRGLFHGAGYPEVRLEWWPDSPLTGSAGGWASRVREAEILVGGAGGDEEIAAPLPDGGTLRLTAPTVDGPLRVLFALARRDAAPSELPELSARREAGEIVGESPALLDALDRLDRLAPGEVPVLLAGESGTGKELAARRLHRRSARGGGPFVALNCAAVDENLLTSDLFGHVQGAFTGADRDRAGVFETAGGGTVFLDEIGDLPARAQGMLLRVLQEGEVRRVGESRPRPVDARVVAASHRDLATLVADGQFRQDLFYRLAVAKVELPPLRERGADVLLLARAFLERWGGGQRLSREVRSWILDHRFPGNVRELENVLRVAALLAGDGGVIGAEHLPAEWASPAPSGRDGNGDGSDGEGSYREKVDAYRRRLVAEALAATDGNQAAAARDLGLTRQALSYLTRQLGVS